jgi:hypothetical protein
MSHVIPIAAASSVGQTLQGELSTHASIDLLRKAVFELQIVTKAVMGY